MKKFFIILLVAFAASGCSKNEGISFCEGVDTEGKGVNCGKVFSTGDLTAVIAGKNSFEADSLTVKISEISNGIKKPEKNMAIEVGREKNRANTTLQFYNGGTYLVEAYRGDEIIAEGKVEVKDTY